MSHLGQKADFSPATDLGPIQRLHRLDGLQRLHFVAAVAAAADHPERRGPLHLGEADGPSRWAGWSGLKMQSLHLSIYTR